MPVGPFGHRQLRVGRQPLHPCAPDIPLAVAPAPTVTSLILISAAERLAAISAATRAGQVIQALPLLAGEPED